MKRMRNNPLLTLNVKSEPIVILPHVNPDGDTLGASLALYEYLTQSNERVWIVSDDPVPFNLEFLEVPCISLEAYKALGAEQPIVISVDSSDLSRLGDRAELLGNAKTTVNIDHHKTNDLYADINLVDPSASSTGEMVYGLLMESDCVLETEIAQALYVAISTDTGSFKYSNTSAETMKICARLIESGIDLNYINTELYQNKPIEKMLILKTAMNNMRLEDNGRLALTWITSSDMQQLGLETLDTDGVSEFFRDIHGVEVVILLKEKTPGVFKGSLRSKHDFDVAELAQRFEGGGHAKAAGLTVRGSIYDALGLVLGAYNEMVG